MSRKPTFDELAGSHQRLGMSIALRMLGNREDAEDAMQNAMVSTWLAFDRYDPARPFTPWYTTIVKNACLDVIHKKGIIAKREEPDQFIDEHPGGFPDPARVLDRKMAREQLWDALGKLSDLHREVIVLRELEGWKYREIAEQLGASEGTIACRIFHARAALRKALGAT